QLPRAGKLAVIRVEFLVKEEKPPDLRPGTRLVGCEISHHLLDAALNQIVDLGLGRKLLAAHVGRSLALDPDAHGLEIYGDARGAVGAAQSGRQRLLDTWKELELGVEIFRGEDRPVVEPAAVLDAIGGRELSICGEEYAIARATPAIGGLDLGGQPIILVI